MNDERFPDLTGFTKMVTVDDWGFVARELLVAAGLPESSLWPTPPKDDVTVTGSDEPLIVEVK